MGFSVKTLKEASRALGNAKILKSICEGTVILMFSSFDIDGTALTFDAFTKPKSNKIIFCEDQMVSYLLKKNEDLVTSAELSNLLLAYGIEQREIVTNEVVAYYEGTDLGLVKRMANFIAFILGVRALIISKGGKL
jgi:hypothetical protein